MDHSELLDRFIPDVSGESRNAVDHYLKDASSWSSIGPQAICTLLTDDYITHDDDLLSADFVSSVHNHHKVLEKMAKEFGTKFKPDYLRELIAKGTIDNFRTSKAKDVPNFSNDIFSDRDAYIKRLTKCAYDYPDVMAAIVPCDESYISAAFHSGTWSEAQVTLGMHGPNRNALLLELAKDASGFLAYVDISVEQKKLDKSVLQELADVVANDQKLSDVTPVIKAVANPHQWMRSASHGQRMLPNDAMEILERLDTTYLRTAGSGACEYLVNAVLENGCPKEQEKLVSFALQRLPLKGLFPFLVASGCPLGGKVEGSMLPVSNYLALQLGVGRPAVSDCLGAVLACGHESNGMEWSDYLKGVALDHTCRNRAWKKEVALINQISPFPDFDTCVKSYSNLPSGLMAALAHISRKQILGNSDLKKPVQSDIDLY